MENKDLRVVSFYGDEIVTFAKDGVPHVAMRRVCENMRLDWARQSVKLGEQSAKFSCCHMPMTGADGKTYEMLAMPLQKLPLWLASINPNKIADAGKRAKVERYQAESAIALHDYWTKGAAFRGDRIDPEEIARIASEAAQRSVAQAIGALLPELVKAQLASGMSIRNGRTSGEIWRFHGLPPLKNGPQWLANRLKEMGASASGEARCEAGLTAARLFDFDRANACMRNGLLDRAKRYVAERTGQGVLKFVPSKKDGAHAPSAQP